MKNLIIIRHAKAEQGFGSDKERKLIEKGRQDAELMAKKLLRKGYKIDKIFSSPSQRTMETTNIFAAIHNVSLDNIKYFDELYLGDTLAIEETVEWLKENISTLAVVGHNPGVTNFTNDITGSDIDDLPTSGIAIIKVNCDDWENYRSVAKALAEVDFPKNV